MKPPATRCVAGVLLDAFRGRNQSEEDDASDQIGIKDQADSFTGSKKQAKKTTVGKYFDKTRINHRKTLEKLRIMQYNSVVCAKTQFMEGEISNELFT